MSELKLIEAVKAGDHAVVEAAGADPELLREKDDYGWTGLHWAAGKGDARAVRRLLEAGADPLEVGRDLRTPYQIALAAGHAEVGRLLRDAEERAGGEHGGNAAREYCAAYLLSELSRFPGWAAGAREEAGGEQHDAGENGSADEHLFLHQDYTVTSSMWHGEGVRFDRVTPEWKQFCTEVLKFEVVDELDLIAPAGHEN